MRSTATLPGPAPAVRAPRRRSIPATVRHAPSTAPGRRGRATGVEPAAVRRPAAAGAAPAVGSRRHVRLTRRGRVLVVGVLAVLLFAAFSLGRVGAEGSTSAQQPELVTATVAPGETLWAVAQRLAPGQDPRPVVEQLRRLNDLDGGGLRAGQQLLLPAA